MQMEMLQFAQSLSSIRTQNSENIQSHFEIKIASQNKKFYTHQNKF